jgi:predicted Zn-dependent peptidase
LTELIADLVRRPHFDEGHLEREKQVILSELGESVDSPDDLVHDHLFEAAFKGQPIGRPVLGNEASVLSVTQADCRQWLEQQFVPGRLILAASGKIEAGQLLRLAERLFGDMAPADTPAIEPASFAGGVRNDRRSFEQAHWCVAYPGLPSADPDNPALAMFVQALGGGTSSRLFQELREERGLAYSVYAWNQAFADTGLVGIGCAADRGQAVESVELARKVLAETADGLTQAELDRARAQIEAGLLMGLETAQGRADQIARSIEVFGRILTVDELLGQIRAVTVEDARTAGRAMLEGPVAVSSVGAKLALAA